MKFAGESKINGVTILETYSVFDVNLLVKLSPFWLKPKPQIYEGNKPGNRLIFLLKTPFGKRKWEGVVTEEKYTDHEISFVDEGTKMPFGLKKWRHNHRIRAISDGVLIRDEVGFSTGFLLLDIAFLPGIWSMFIYRKPRYPKIVKQRMDSQ